MRLQEIWNCIADELVDTEPTISQIMVFQLFPLNQILSNLRRRTIMLAIRGSVSNIVRPNRIDSFVYQIVWTFNIITLLSNYCLLQMVFAGYVRLRRRNILSVPNFCYEFANVSNFLFSDISLIRDSNLKIISIARFIFNSNHCS